MNFITLSSLFSLLLFTTTTTATASSPSPPPDSSPLLFLRTLPLAENAYGRIDHMSYDPNTFQLFVCGFEDSTTTVVNTYLGNLVSVVTNGLNNPQGPYILPQPAVNNHEQAKGRLFVANDETGAVEVYGEIESGNSYKFPHYYSIDLEEDADNIRYNDHTGKIYVGYGDGAEGEVPPAIAVIDPLYNQVIQRYSLPAHPESFQILSNATKLYANTPNTSSLTVVDMKGNSDNIEWHIPTPSGDGKNLCFPMALAENHGPNGTLFVGCRNPPSLAVVDAVTGETVSQVGIGDHCDDVWWDEARQRVYVSSREGFVTVIQSTQNKDNSYDYSSIANVTTYSGAQTSFFDPISAQLFVPQPHLNDDDPPAQILVYLAV